MAKDIRDLADEEVMQLVQGGNPRSFELLYDRRRETMEGVEERQEAPERTDVEVARREEARSIRDALETLPDEQRKTIELAYFGGFSHSQIAELLDEPIGTVKGRMRLRLDKMRRHLAETHAAGGVA